jgi:hypothetical protein
VTVICGLLDDAVVMIAPLPPETTAFTEKEPKAHMFWLAIELRASGAGTVKGKLSSTPMQQNGHEMNE